MATICPYCNIEVSESAIEAEDGCCPECGSVISASSSFLGEDPSEFDDGINDDELFEDFDEEEYESVTCPNCNNDFYFEPAMYDEEEDLVCPHCGKPFKLPED